MNTDLVTDNDALEGPIFPTFVRYLIPSLVGLLAMTSASLVDGIFIGNYVGVTALAAVNLIIPITTLLFGVSMMVSIGGSVRAGKYFGENKVQAASAIFSKTMLFMILYGVLVVALGLILETKIFSALGATPELFPVMSEYYRIIMPFLLAQFIVIQIYFFIRMDGFPNLAAAILIIGAAANIVLDYLFIAVYGWGLTGAALATGLSELLSLMVGLLYFWLPKRRLHLKLRQKNWREVFQAAYNGISEFINEVSGAIIAFVFNWMLIQRAGVVGVAAITLVNYLLFVGFMIYFSISDSIQVMISQNFGAKKRERIHAFFTTACLFIAGFSLIFIFTLMVGSETLIGLFINTQENTETVQLALEFFSYIWPLFIFAGFNMLISGYLTAVHLPFQSAVVATSRSLIMPIGFLILFYMLLSDYRFVAAISLAEAVSFVLAVTLYISFSPKKIVPE
jgi:putative MATE family efflux protein